jgi:hypothetical protein
MRWRCLILALWALAAAARAADESQSVLTLPCAQVASSSASCDPSPADLKKAKGAFSRGVKLEKARRLDEAYAEFDTAARLAPRNVDYITALAMMREQLAFEHLERGNQFVLDSKEVEAQAEFRSALNLDPQNEFAQQRLNDSLDQWAPKLDHEVRIVQDSGELHVNPNDVRQEFHFRGDSHSLLAQVAAAFGVDAEIDDSVVSRRVHFDLDSTDFFTAMSAACQVTGTFFAPLSEKQIYLLKNTDENHRQFDRLGLRTFHVSTTNPTELNEITNAIRVLFDVRFLSQSVQTGEVAVRAPLRVLEAITEFMQRRGQTRPQVMLDIQIFEIDHQFTRSLGVHIPDQFTLYNIPAAALAALGGQSIQNLVNQLIASGGINQATSQGLAGLLAQLTGQQNSIFSQPLATFGGGLTLMGLAVGTLSAQASLNQSSVKTLEHAVLRAAQNADTNFRMGERYPILNASYAPVFNSSAISQVLQNQSYQAPFPSFNYEDLGLLVKAKPSVYANSDIGLNLEIELRTLAGQSINGVPVIANRQYKGSITLSDGEPAVVAGSLSRSEMRSMTGIPGLGALPGLTKLLTTNTKTTEDDEILIVIAPHVLTAMSSDASEIWLSRQ